MKVENQDMWIGDKDLNHDPEFIQSNSKDFNEYLPIADTFGDNRSLDVTSNSFPLLLLLPPFFLFHLPEQPTPYPPFSLTTPSSLPF